VRYCIVNISFLLEPLLIFRIACSVLKTKSVYLSTTENDSATNRHNDGTRNQEDKRKIDDRKI